MNTMDFGGDGEDEHGQQVLLSCSHLFHRACLEAFECFNIYEVCLCPVCRDSYTKIGVENVVEMAYGDGRFYT